MKASSFTISRLTAALHHLLSTLHDGRCRTPCKTRFRLAGCAFAGRGVEPAGSLRKVSDHVILLSRAYPGAITVPTTRAGSDDWAGERLKCSESAILAFRGKQRAGRFHGLSERVWTPPLMQAVFGRLGACGQVLSCVRPLYAADDTPRARMEIRGLGPNRLRELESSPFGCWFSQPGLVDLCPYLSSVLPTSPDGFPHFAVLSGGGGSPAALLLRQ